MTMNFSDVLNKKAGEIERPPLIPLGTYRMSVKAIPEATTSADGKWDNLDFVLQLVEAQEDVDPNALQEYGGLGNHSVSRMRFLFNKEDAAAFDRTLFNLKRFLLDHLKIEGDNDTDLKTLLNSSAGMQCLGFISHRQDKNDPETQYVEIRRTAPLE